MTSTRRIQITISHTPHASMSDGCGNNVKHGQIVTVPNAVADAFIAKGFARPAEDGVIVAKAEAEAKAAMEERVLANRKQAADLRMTLWDSLPAEIRAKANEEGDSVIHDYLEGLPSMPLEQYEAAPGEPFIEARDQAEPAKKRRGRPPKLKTSPEGSDPS